MNTHTHIFTVCCSLALAMVVMTGCSRKTTSVESVYQPPEEVTTNSDGSTIQTSPSASASDSTTTTGNTAMPAVRSLQDFTPIVANQVTIETTKGTIVFDIFTDTAPLTATNFLTLAQDGFYEGVVFHRVEPGFVIQAGDPQSKDATKKQLWGTGGPGYTIKDEFDTGHSHDSAGVVAMAKTGMPDSAGSQFYITLAPAPFLDGSYAVFGKVTAGLDVVQAIEVGDSITSVSFK